MYIKLGNTGINYGLEDSSEKYMIISDIVDSSLSYESPVIVNTVEELDIWFSKNFTDRDYLVSLLNKGVSLYLYKPISTSRVSEDDFIDYENFSEVKFSSVPVTTDSFIGAIETWKTGNYKLLENESSQKIKVLTGVISPFINYRGENGYFHFDDKYNSLGVLKLVNTIQRRISLSPDPDYKSISDTKGFLLQNLSGEDILLIFFNENNDWSSSYIKNNTCYKIYYKVTGWELVEVDSINKYLEYKDGKFIESLNNDIPVWEGISVVESDLDALKLIKDSDNIKIYSSEDNEYYIWYNGEFIPESMLPQNNVDNSNSLNNRSTLLVTTPYTNNLLGISYVYPEFYNSKLGVFSNTLKNLSLSTDYKSNIDIDSIYKKNYQTFVFSLTYSDDSNLYDGFLTLNIGGLTFAFTAGTIDENIVGDSFIKLLEDKKETSTDFINNIINTISSLSSDTSSNYYSIFKEISVEKESENKLYILSKGLPFSVNNFYSFNGIKLVSDQFNTNLLLTKYIYDNSLGSLEFYSKTIGTYDDSVEDNGKITVTIEKLDTDGYYRFTISRFDYTEIYEGSVIQMLGTPTIDYYVSKYSKLVYCNLISSKKISGYGLQEGSYTLENVSNIKENITCESWFDSLDRMLGDNCTREILPDYFLISNIKNYISSLDPNYDYYKEYETFLKYSESIGMQFLIQNNPSNYYISIVNSLPDTFDSKLIYAIYSNDGYTFYLNGEEITDREIIMSAIYGGDFVFNYINDLDNRLVYFYSSIDYKTSTYPGFAPYLNMVLSDDFSEKFSDNFVYYSPGGMTTYENTEFEDRLDKYKCNYLTFNNHCYYFNKINSGESPNTSGFLRFILGKISRELNKQKGSYLSEKNLNTIYKYIDNNILYVIQKTFGNIVQSIKITGFVPNLEENTLNIEIETKVLNLVDKDITLNITLNYNS